MAASTQEHIPIKNIHDDLVILKDGSAAVVLNTSAVNFDLLSESEQMAIIDAFAALLNSLSFAIQIVVRSKRLDISTYLESLHGIEEKQTNPLLAELIKSYRNFIETTTQENQVLDKQFFIVIQVSYLEIGFSGDTEKNIDKALAILLPRRDHIIRQLNRIGLTATQLNNEALINLYYEMYNESTIDIPAPPPAPTPQPVTREVASNMPQATANNIPTTAQTPVASSPQQIEKPIPIINPPIPNSLPPTTSPQPQATNSIPQKQISVTNSPALNLPPNARVLHPSTPFVVEELPD